MKSYFAIVLLLLLAAHESGAQQNCDAVINLANDYLSRGYYTESLKLVRELEATQAGNTRCLNREFYDLKVRALLAVQERDGLIDTAMKKMIDADPTYPISASNYSPAFYNRYTAYNIYPNLQVGLGVTVSRMRYTSYRDLPLVYREASQLGNAASGVFLSTGITASAAYYFQRYVAGKFEMTQNFPAQSGYRYELDEANSVDITEEISSRSFSGLLIGKVGLFRKASGSSPVDHLGIELGYQLFDLQQSNSRYEWLEETEAQAMEIKYSNEVDTEPFRANSTHNALIGIIYEPPDFINSNRLKVIVGLRYIIGLSDYNRVENRLDNQVATQLYYFAEDQLRMNTLQLQLHLGYNVNYHKKKRQ